MSRRHRPGTRGGGPAALFVDSSAWIALFSARDQNHEKADRLFRSAIAGRLPLVTTCLVLAEVHRLVLFRAGARASMAVLERMTSSRHVRVEFPAHDLHREAVAWLVRLSGTPVTYTDATSFAVMQSQGCLRALSFDRHFISAGFELWTGEAD